ncbi:MAG: class I SAM-dependent methyltransferase family protein [Thermoplasmata archaeon]|nr:class I SAM-dependent methyltransferase family protein [Thermoplasmata archaeon]
MAKHMAAVAQKQDAEKVRKKLMEMNAMIRGLKVRRDDKYVYFPVMAKPRIEGVSYIDEMDFEENKNKSYIELSKEKRIPLDSISIDFIGDIAVIRCDENISSSLAEILIKSNKSVKAVYLDRGVKEEYRVRELKFLAGKDVTETIHIENGVRIKLDIAKVYFSPRLAGERMRVARKVIDNEVIIDMFTGVAPFPLVIARHGSPSKIYGIDINPVAVKYATENVKMNGFDGIIEILHGDAGEIIKNLPDADRIIMNLPHRSREFLSAAVEKGRIIHYYEIVERDKIDKRMEEIEKEYGVKVESKRIVGSYSPSREKVVFDIIV